MCPNYFNLVSTRSCDGDHTALQRWYSDHIGILWRSDSLREATLLRREDGDGNEADYLCAYGFTDEAGFQAYENGPHKAAAARVIAEGWGRQGIAITERRQYRRCWQRRVDPGASLPVRHTMASLELGAGDPHEVSRWLVDQVHRLFGDGALRAATLYQGAGTSAAGGEVLLSLQANGELPDWRRWLDGGHPAWGQAPAGVTPRWGWRGHPVMHWSR